MLQILKYTNKESYGNMYIVIDNNEYIIIDPCINYKDVENIIKDKTNKGVILTHAHYDHFCEIDSWIQQGFSIYLSPKAINNLKDSHLNACTMFNLDLSFVIPPKQTHIVNELENLSIGNHVGTFYGFPGHTDCSIGFIIDNHFFCGDFVFEHRGYGRVDLDNGSAIELRNSLRKLKTLSHDLIVHSGHGEDFDVQELYIKK